MMIQAYFVYVSSIEGIQNEKKNKHLLKANNNRKKTET